MPHESEFIAIAKYAGRVPPQQVHANPGIFERPSALRIPIFYGNIPPTPELKDRLIQQARIPVDFNTLSGRFDHSESALAIDIKAKTGRVFNVMSSIGLGSLVPYKTIESIDLSDAEE